MQQFSEWNKGYRYLPMVIDVFSKYGWIERVRVRVRVRVRDLTLYSTENEEKSSVVER